MNRRAFVCAVGLVVVILALVVTQPLKQFFVPDGYLFFEQNDLCHLFETILLCFPACDVLYYLIDKIRTKPVKVHLPKKVAKFRPPIYFAWFFALCLCVTNFTYVTDEKIVIVTPFDLSGKEYSYSDVVKVETGFGDQTIAMHNYNIKGNFYYKFYF